MLDFLSDKNTALKFLKKHNIDLTLEEIQNLQQNIGRSLHLAEVILLSIQLSEHCSYKSTRKFLQKFPTKASQVILGPGEDAGIVEIFTKNEEKYAIAIAQESHNHPSQIVPYEGAATGVGGIVRDIVCMGAKPIGILDSLRLGQLEKNTTKNIAKEVISGIAGYGNPLGVPNVGGDCFFDQEFDQNCLVNVTAIGTLRNSDLIHSYVPEIAKKEQWDLLLVGKATDNSGFGGASFASGSFSESDDVEKKAAAVQQPNPFLERHLIVSILDLLEELKKIKKYHQIVLKDLGAGGVACATVEIAEGGSAGAEIDLAKLHVAKSGYDPHVILCSETQERFCFACHPDLTQIIIDHFMIKWDLGSVADQAGISCIGKITDNGQYRVKFNEEILCDLPASLVTKGILYDRPYSFRVIPSIQSNVTFSNGMIRVE